MASKIEKEIQAATKVKAKAKEERNAYLVRVAEAVSDLEDAAYGELSKDAQDWANVAIKAGNSDKEVPDFPDVNGKDADAEGEVEVKETKRTRKPVTAAAAPEAKEAKETKADKKPVKEAKATAKAKADKPVKVANSGGVGIKVQIKQLMIVDPNISIDDIMAKLKKTELSRLTASTVRAEFRNSLRVLHDEGKLKGVPTF